MAHLGRLPDETRRSKQRASLLLLTVFALGIALAAIIYELTSARASVRPVPFQRGVTIADWGTDAYRGRRYAELVKSLNAAGVDTVTLLVVWRQNGNDSVKITPDSGTVSTARLVKAIKTAHTAHLRVILKPYIGLRSGTWRGLITPSSVGQWFASYDAFIVRYAKLAQKEHVQGFVVGTEMQSMQQYANRWRALIGEVRHVYTTGFVTYQANAGAARNIMWWDALDVIDISAYYPLNDSGNDSVPDLVQGWSSAYHTLANLHLKFHRDVMFGELGYTPYTGTFAKPWVTAPLGRYSAAAQGNGYAAAFKVWYPTPFFKGFEPWYVSSNPGLRRTDSGNDEPRAPALKVLSHWYRNKTPAG